MRERSMKYAHNMMENLGMQMHEFKISQARFDERLQRQQQDDHLTAKTINLIFEKIESIQRLVWIGVGGVIVLGGVVTIIGSKLLRVLGG